MDTTLTSISMPNTSLEVSVSLPNPSLRTIDFSGLDFTTARQAIIEYIITYYPDTFNDFIASNGIIMMTEIVASVVSKLALRSDIIANESTLPTARSEEAVVNHLALINQRLQRQTPASADILVSVDQPTLSDINIPAGQIFQLTGPDGSTVYYEIFSSPNDWISDITIPSGKRGIIAFGIEGRFAGNTSVVSSGGANQIITITNDNILESPIMVSVSTGNYTEDWTVITEPIERYRSTDKVVEAIFFDNKMKLRFGDNITGLAPSSGSVISINYRVGGGARGRIGVGQINASRPFTPLPPYNVITSVSFVNIAPSDGGMDKESISAAKKRAPRDFAVNNSIVTANDYVQAAKSYSHPVYGTVNKAAAVASTGFSGTSVNPNVVNIYILAIGADGLPCVSNIGLKTGLKTYLDNWNVLTDDVVILDGELLPVDIDMTVVINRNSDASIIKTKVDTTIDSFFDINNWEMGQPFYISNFIEAIKSVDGVDYVDLYKPINNILNSDGGVGFNEVIVLGNRTVNYYYQR